MAGVFELFVDADSLFRFRLKAPDGTVVAVSGSFRDRSAAVQGIAAVREYAGMGLITDLTARVGSPRAAGQELRDPRPARVQVGPMPATDRSLASP